MNQVLNFSFLPLIICLFIRYFVAKAAGVSVVDVRTFANWEMWVYGVSIALAGTCFWHIFVRNRCPECNSHSVRSKGEKEYNQVHRIKKVTEKDNNGRSVTRNLNVTIAQIRHFYSCNDCNHPWITESEREK